LAAALRGCASCGRTHAGLPAGLRQPLGGGAAMGRGAGGTTERQITLCRSTRATHQTIDVAISVREKGTAAQPRILPFMFFRF